MGTYEQMIIEANKEGIEILEMNFRGNAKGYCSDNVIGISKKIRTNSGKRCILAEEIGHLKTTHGNITDQTKTENRKQELRARRWAVKRLIRVEDFIDALNVGVRNKAELAEFLEVTEDFVDMAIEHFKGIYGYSHTIGEYTICFSPLWVYKRFE